MQNLRSNELLSGGSIDDLERAIPPEDRGPVFFLGEIVDVKGYGYRVTGLKKNRLFLKPWGKLNAQAPVR